MGCRRDGFRVRDRARRATDACITYNPHHDFCIIPLNLPKTTEHCSELYLTRQKRLTCVKIAHVCGENGGTVVRTCSPRDVMNCALLRHLTSPKSLLHLGSDGVLRSFDTCSEVLRYKYLSQDLLFERTYSSK